MKTPNKVKHGSRVGFGGLVHGQSIRGGRRVGAGAPLSNTNSQKKLQLPEGFDLSNGEGICRFLREFVVPAAVTGGLGVRNVTAITSACRLLLDFLGLEVLEQRIKSLEEAKDVVVT